MMQRSHFTILSRVITPVTLIACLLTGCGNQISQIDGLPQTRDVADVPWPKLVDTPAAPTDALLLTTGAQTLVTLENAQVTALSRQAQAGPARVETAALQERVTRIRAQTETTGSNVDNADLSSRAARLTQAREAPSTGVDIGALRARGERLAAVRAQNYGNVDGATLQARADRIRSQTQTYYGDVDRIDLQQRAQRAAVLSSSTPNAPSLRQATSAQIARLPINEMQITEAGSLVEAVPEPAPKPTANPRRQSRDEPVLSNDFRKRAREAVERARKRAAAPPPE